MVTLRVRVKEPLPVDVVLIDDQSVGDAVDLHSSLEGDEHHVLTVVAELWIWGVPLLCHPDLRKKVCIYNSVSDTLIFLAVWGITLSWGNAMKIMHGLSFSPERRVYNQELRA